MIVRRVLGAVLLVFIAKAALALDFPHTYANPILPGITCLNCHNLHGGLTNLLQSKPTHPEQDDDDTPANNLCWSCHVSGDVIAPYRVPHSSVQIDGNFADWNIECKDCHNPHYQPQIAEYGSATHLFSGTLDGIAAETLTDNGATWTIDEHAGRVVFPDIDAKNRRNRNPGNLSYRILSNTATTLTLDVDDAKPLTGVSYFDIGDTFAIVYGKLIRHEIQVPNTTTFKPVKFYRATGDNSYADSDGTMDGVCQVCHTKTGHFRNDGSAPDQLHYNADPGDPNGTAGEKCTDKCHKHIGGFGHGKGYTKADLCVECHGHEEGTIYDPDATYPYDPDGSTLTSRGFGSVTAHSTHTESWHTAGAGWEVTQPAAAGADDKKGPGIYCSVCHDTNNMPTFKSGVNADSDPLFNLAETDVCNNCHSPNGSYNGVNSVGGSVGAKSNWHSGGVYDNDGSLKPGKEKWCAGCHDEEPSHIVLADRSIDVYAPSVIGDEDAPYTYGTGWGFYKTGHGVPSTETIPATGGVKNGPGRNCPDCHLTTTAHIDGNHRTFDCSDTCNSDEYQASYRLQLIGGLNPMEMPRLVTSPTIREDSFRLCFSCHDFEAITDQAGGGTESPGTSNYYDTEQAGVKNLHYYHLNDGDTARISADWSGSWNSRFSCILCHNPHGTKNHTMLRTGELVGLPPFRTWFWNSSLGAFPINLVSDPDPTNITLAGSDRSIFAGNEVNGTYCSAECHGAAVQVVRDAFQGSDQIPLLNWAGNTGYEFDGATPDAAPAGTTFTFRVEYRDYDGDAPTSIYVWVDDDDNGTFEDPADRHTLTPAAVEPQPYISGVDYTTTLTLGKAGDNVISYYFAAADADGTATGDATNVSTLDILNAGPTLEWTGDTNYTADGVNPNYGANGGTYTFKVKYVDEDGDTCPITDTSAIQVWIDVDDDGYEAGEKHNMTEVSAPDTNCTSGDNGKLYTYDAVLSNTGTHNYRFYASDGSDDATGTPVSDSSVTVDAGATVPPSLDWIAESCRDDGVRPALGLQTGDYVFKVNYTDFGNTPPASIQVWVDSSGSATKESHTLTLQTAGSDYTDGETYAATVQLDNAGVLDYYFTASNGTDSAVGTPMSTATYYVTVTSTALAKGVRSGGAGDPWYSSIQTALDNTPNGAGYTILVYEGNYTEANDGLYFDPVGDTGTTVKSVCGPALTTIQATSGRGVYAYRSHGSSVDGFQIIGGTTGGVYSFDSNTFSVNNVWIHSNTGTGFGLSVARVATITNSKIYNNTGRGLVLSGNAVHNLSNLEITNNTVTSMTGAGIFMQNIASAGTYSNITVSDNVITGTAQNGGGIYFNSVSNVTFDGCTMSGNTATGSGGAFSSSNGSLTFKNCIFADNTAGVSGGAIIGNSTVLSFVNSTLAGNQANGGDGGAIWSQNDPVTFTNSIIWNNSASGSGHAAYSNSGSITLTDSVIQNDDDGNLTDAPGFSNITPTISGFSSDNDPNFVNAAGGDYHIQNPSDAIGNATDAPADDRDGVSRPQGSADDIGAYEYLGSGSGNTSILDWTGEANYITDGVNPDNGSGGDSFEFRVEYTHPDNHPPSLITVWVDVDGNGSFAANEKHTMTKVVGGDNDYTDGVLYTKTLTLSYAGSAIEYRFFASDGTDTATGDPNGIKLIPMNNGIPTLEWTGETNYTEDGIHPDTAAAGTSFAFHIDYVDTDNTAPSVIETWIDLDDSETYEDGEKFAMTETDGGDTTYSDGKRYYYNTTLPYTGDGVLKYRFYAKDGTHEAAGSGASIKLAKERYSRVAKVTAPVGNNAPTLAWSVGNACMTEGVRPPTGAGGGDFEFIVSYSDADDQCASSIQVMVDENDNGTYESGEKYALTEVDGGDTVCTDGKLYSTIATLSTAGDGILTYKYFATDGLELATGTPVSTGSTMAVYNALKVRPTGGSGWFSTIQDAVNSATDPQTVVVWPSSTYTMATYSEDVTFNLKRNLTLVSACGADLTTISGSGNVVYFQQADNPVVDGFTITGGTVGINALNDYGTGTDFVIKNSKIHSNGTGISMNSNIGTRPFKIQNTEIYANSTRGINSPSGIYLEITDSAIHSHNVTVNGAAMYLNGTTSTTITNTVIRDNTSTGGSGGINVNGGAATLTITNSIVADNQGTNGGAIATNTGPTVNIINSTFADNNATNGGFMYICSPGVTTIRNSLFWNNTVSGSGDNIYKACGAGFIGTISDSYFSTSKIFNATYTSTDNDDEVDPEFVDAAGDNYHLKSISPAIGKANAAYAPDDDIDGDARPQLGTDDRGADEFVN